MDQEDGGSIKKNSKQARAAIAVLLVIFILAGGFFLLGYVKVEAGGNESSLLGKMVLSAKNFVAGVSDLFEKTFSGREISVDEFSLDGSPTAPNGGSNKTAGGSRIDFCAFDTARKRRILDLLMVFHEPFLPFLLTNSCFQGAYDFRMFLVKNLA